MADTLTIKRCILYSSWLVFLTMLLHDYNYNNNNNNNNDRLTAFDPGQPG